LSNVIPAARPVAHPAAQVVTQPVPGPAGFQIAPAAAMAQRPHSKRWLWMTAGALATAAVVIAAIEFAPWKGTKAAPQTPPAQQTQTQSQEQVRPPAVPAPQPAVDQPAASQPQPAPQTQTSKRTAASHPPPVLLQSPLQQQAQPAVQQPVVQQPVVQQPVQQPVQPPAGPSRAELQAAREEMMQLGVRANGIRGSLQSLQRSQAASGLNLSSKFTDPEGLMDGYLKGAADALRDGDLDSAKSFLEKAERQVQILEKLLNR
jgi:hypothetical protein